MGRIPPGGGEPVVADPQGRIPAGLHGPVVLASRGGENLHDQRRRRFDAAVRDLRGLSDDHEVRLDDVVGRQDQVNGGVKHLAEIAGMKVVFQLPLKPPGDTLMARTRRRRHVDVSFHKLVALPVGRDPGVVGVVELLLESGDHVSRERSYWARNRSTSSGSSCRPSRSPISPRIVLISFSDFFPKFFVFKSSGSVRCTRSAMVRMLAVFRQLDARTDSSSSSTLRKRFSFSSARTGTSRSTSSSTGRPCGNWIRSSKWSCRIREASPTAVSGETLPLVHVSRMSRSWPPEAPLIGSTWKFTRRMGLKLPSMRTALMGSASGSRFSAAT